MKVFKGNHAQCEELEFEYNTLGAATSYIADYIPYYFPVEKEITNSIYLEIYTATTVANEVTEDTKILC